MRLLLLLFALPAYAALNITSATLDVTGFIVTASFNGNTLTGSTAGCFTLSGGNTNSDTISAAVISGGATTVVITPAAPLYGAQTITVSLLTAPGCALVGSTGVAAPSSVTATNSSEWQAASGAPMSTYAQYDGSPAFGDQFGEGYPNMVSWNSALGSIRVNVANASAVHIWAFNASNFYCAQQDGVDIGTRQSTSGSSVFSDITLASGLSGTHLYRALGCSGSVGFQNVLIAAVRFVGGTLTGSVPVALPTVGACGDSIVGSGSGPDDSRTVDWWLDSINNGYASQISTQSGALVSGGGLDVACVTRSVLFGGAQPDVWVLEGGVNDQRNSVATGPGSTFRNAMSTMITGVQGNAHPPKVLLVRGILPNLDANNVNLPNYVADQAAAAASAGVCLYHTSSLASGAPDWINPTTSEAACNSQSYPPIPTQDTLTGNLHPCAATTLAEMGYGKIANREAPIFAGYTAGQSFTPTVTNGVDARISLTLPGVATWVDPVTATSSNATDYLCFGSTCGTHTVTMPVSAGASVQTLVVNGSAGSRTITWSGAADCWTAPAPTTVMLTQATYTLIGDQCRVTPHTFAALTITSGPTAWTSQ